MGLADRDYMRERYRRRGGAEASPVWRDEKARVEFDECDLVTRSYRRRKSGSATRRSESHASSSLARILIPLLCLAGAGIPIFADMRRGGWLPDLTPGMPFPETGSVSVATDLPISIVRSRLSVSTSSANAVVQLVDPGNGRHALSVFVAANSEIDIPAPVGIWRMRVIEGQKWHGTSDFFGPNTQFETVARLMEFTAARGNGIDLHRTPNGDLPTRMMLTGPEPL